MASAGTGTEDIPNVATEWLKRLDKDPKGKKIKLKVIKHELQLRNIKTIDIVKKRDKPKALERLRDAIEPEAEREAALRAAAAGNAGASYPPFNGQLEDGRDIESLDLAQLKSELNALGIFARAKKRETLIAKLWEVLEAQYIARMEADNVVGTFQAWRQAANENRAFWLDEADLHRRLVMGARQGDFWAVQACLEEGAAVNYQSKTGGESALMVAAEMGHFDVVEQLLLWGADAQLENALGQTALSMAALRRKHKVVEAIRSVWRLREPHKTLRTIDGVEPGERREHEYDDIHCYDDPSIYADPADGWPR